MRNTGVTEWQKAAGGQEALPRRTIGLTTSGSCEGSRGIVSGKMALRLMSARAEADDSFELRFEVIDEEKESAREHYGRIESERIG